MQQVVDQFFRLRKRSGLKQIGEVVETRVRLELLQGVEASAAACFPQCRRMAVRVIGVPVIEIRPETARIRSGPHHEADPLQVALARKMPQRTVSLGLQRIREFRVSLSVIHEGPERTLDFVRNAIRKGLPVTGSAPRSRENCITWRSQV